MAVLHTHRFGDPGGEPLLVVHGITAHGRRFRRLAEEAWPRRRTIAVDLRGHGRSTYEGPWSIPQHVTDLLDTLDGAVDPGAADTAAPGAIDVVSHSYGGAIALAMLAKAPERVRRLVLLDPAIALPASHTDEAAVAALEHPGWATVEEATIARNAGLGDEIDPAVTEDIAEHLVLAADGRFRMRFHKPAVVTGWGEMSYALPASITPVPTLLVVADRAGLVSEATVDGLTGLLGDHLCVEHLDCGHMLYWERFDDTARLVSTFLT